jgi:hypothetical protein
MPLPGLELETSGFDTMLCLIHQPNEPKSLSDWEEVGNPLTQQKVIPVFNKLQ